jgi:hypothetical protein
VQAPLLSELRLAADPAAWTAAGFDVRGGRLEVDGTRIVFAAGEGGIVDWALTETRAAGIDGLATRLGANPTPSADARHPNGVSAIDHVVVVTPQLERTTAAFEGAGVELRRTREGETGLGPRRQAFFRVGRPILELVESHELGSEEPARFWGITFATDDLDAAADLLGDKLGRVKDAIQPGRRIATVRKEARLGLPVALISR